MPQAWTLTRTIPDPASGMSRSTISNGPPARGTCTARIFAMKTSKGFDDTTRVLALHLFDRLIGRSDERCHFIVQFFARLFVNVDHVSGLVPGVLKVRPQVGRDRQVIHLVLGGKEWGCEIEISAIQHN